MITRVLLADDHQLLRQALRVFLETDASLRIVAETGDGLEVVPLACQAKVDVVCMDINMPGMNGIETTRCLIAARPEVKIIGVSALSDQRHVQDMLDAGAKAYVTKAAPSEHLLNAIRAVRNGQTYFCPAIAAALMSAPRRTGKPARRGAEGLGHRERQVLQLVAEGHSSSQISALLNIAPATVDVHRRNIMRKLDLHNVAELTKFAVRSGITEG